MSDEQEYDERIPRKPRVDRATLRKRYIVILVILLLPVIALGSFIGLSQIKPKKEEPICGGANGHNLQVIADIMSLGANVDDPRPGASTELVDALEKLGFEIQKRGSKWFTADIETHDYTNACTIACRVKWESDDNDGVIKGRVEIERDCI